MNKIILIFLFVSLFLHKLHQFFVRFLSYQFYQMNLFTFKNRFDFSFALHRRSWFSIRILQHGRVTCQFKKNGGDMSRDMEGIERIRAGPAAGGKRPEDMNPQELHAVLWQVLTFRDSGTSIIAGPN